MSDVMLEGRIVKALSGFYYVETAAGEFITCRARGKFRNDGTTPLVGDRVRVQITEPDTGVVQEILPRRNAFVRPPVANVDVIVILAAAVNPITSPFLIDRIAAISSWNNCETIICINKVDLDPGDTLYALYRKAGFLTLRTSAETGEGVDALCAALAGKTCAFVGNSGVGKSSLLNALSPGFTIKTAEVSEKLGRGRHTTRHIELYPLGGDTQIADTPGFSSFNTEQMELVIKEDLQYTFQEFRPYLDRCMFRDCMHLSEKGCAVLAAVQNGEISASRHESYVRLFNHAKAIKEWQIKKE